MVSLSSQELTIPLSAQEALQMQFTNSRFSALPGINNVPVLQDLQAAVALDDSVSCGSRVAAFQCEQGMSIGFGPVFCDS
jgi:hypothetical protein